MSNQPPPVDVTLDTPIKRGATEIASIEIRKPNSGGLRGVSLRALLDFETDSIIKVLPRVTEPALTPAEAERMDPADLLQAGSAIASFLLPRRMLAGAQQTPDSLLQ